MERRNLVDASWSRDQAGFWTAPNLLTRSRISSMQVSTRTIPESALLTGNFASTEGSLLSSLTTNLFLIMEQKNTDDSIEIGSCKHFQSISDQLIIYHCVVTSVIEHRNTIRHNTGPCKGSHTLVDLIITCNYQNSVCIMIS